MYRSPFRPPNLALNDRPQSTLRIAITHKDAFRRERLLRVGINDNE